MHSGTSDSPVQCAHHWVIETPNGPVSRGFCRTCGVERGFYNDHEDAQRVRGPTEQVPVGETETDGSPSISPPTVTTDPSS
jgi:hypothetical protein